MKYNTQHLKSINCWEVALLTFAVVCSSNCSSSDLLCEAASRSFSKVSSSCLRSWAFAAKVKHSSARAAASSSNVVHPRPYSARMTHATSPAREVPSCFSTSCSGGSISHILVCLIDEALLLFVWPQSVAKLVLHGIRRDAGQGRSRLHL